MLFENGRVLSVMWSLIDILWYTPVVVLRSLVGLLLCTLNEKMQNSWRAELSCATNRLLFPSFVNDTLTQIEINGKKSLFKITWDCNVQDIQPGGICERHVFLKCLDANVHAIKIIITWIVSIAGGRFPLKRKFTAMKQNFQPSYKW